jgi:hypothetical protein
MERGLNQTKYVSFSLDIRKVVAVDLMSTYPASQRIMGAVIRNHTEIQMYVLGGIWQTLCHDV